MAKFKDYTDKQIGRVKVIKLSHTDNNHDKWWECICSCGFSFQTRSRSFLKGDTYECEKCRLARRRGPDLTGRKYGRWTVIGQTVDVRNKTQWHVKCDCGNEGQVSTSALGKRGKSMSCGCLGRKEKSKYVNTTLYPKAHGLAHSKFYSIRTSLIHKCYNPKHPSYKNYGAKNIKICDLWRNSAEEMYKWAKENRWKEKSVFTLKHGQNEFNPLTVVILDEDEFCENHARYMKESAHKIDYNGHSLTARQWATVLDIPLHALRYRLQKFETVDKAFAVPYNESKFCNNPELIIQIVRWYDEGLTFTEIAKKLDLSPPSISYHFSKLGIAPHPKRCKYSLDHFKMWQDYLNGMKKSELSRKYRVPWHVIAKWIKKYTKTTQKK